MSKVVEKIAIKAADVGSVQAALTKLIGSARLAHRGGAFGGSSTILVEDEDGWNLTGVQLVMDRLTDGSTVFKVEFLFDTLAGLTEDDVLAQQKEAKPEHDLPALSIERLRQRASEQKGSKQ